MAADRYGYWANPPHWRRFIITLVILLLCLSLPLFQLVRFAWGSELYSYAILIPFVSAGLIWLKRPLPTASGTKLSPLWALALIFSGIGMLGAYILTLLSPTPVASQDALALAMYSLVLLLAGICCWFLPRPTLRAIAFPLGFLIFLAPLPVMLEESLETFLQYGSAWVAHGFFQIIGTPVFRDGTIFHLPGFTMQVAPECSGIHSTLALFITSLVAGPLLLNSRWSRIILAFSVLPIALLRNGLRVTVIGELCVRIGPEMINSYIHKHGGPIFFLISLIPFFLVLFFLLKFQRSKAPPSQPPA